MTGFSFDPADVPAHGAGGDAAERSHPSHGSPRLQRFTVVRSDRRWLVIDNDLEQSLCACHDVAAARFIANALNYKPALA